MTRFFEKQITQHAILKRDIAEQQIVEPCLAAYENAIISYLVKITIHLKHALQKTKKKR